MTPKTKTFWERTFSTVILLSILGGAVAWDEPLGYGILIALFCNLTTIEWYRMLKGRAADRPLVLVGGLVYPWLLLLITQGVICSPQLQGAELLSAVMLGGGGLALYSILAFARQILAMDYKGKSGQLALAGAAETILAFVYPVWLLCFAFWFCFKGCHEECHFLLWIVLVTKMSDIWAYVTGVLFGGKFITARFSPAVSPKKSWEGIIGSFIITTALGVLLGHGILASADTLFLTLFSAVIFVVAVFGDLAGSLIKRGLGVKDSGSLLPGIGGIFDLIDSPSFTVSLSLFILPALYLIC